MAVKHFQTEREWTDSWELPFVSSMSHLEYCLRESFKRDGFYAVDFPQLRGTTFNQRQRVMGWLAETTDKIGVYLVAPEDGVVFFQDFTFATQFALTWLSERLR
jgi:hypothetical protein